MLDGAHFHFLKSDIKDFDRYRDTLDDLTRKRDTQPANEIFSRFLHRVEQRVEYAAELLRTETWDFSDHERYTPDRRHSEWPEDLDAAKVLWKQHLRYEYLQEKLGKQKPDEILKTLSNRYKRLLRTLGEFDSDDVLELYLTALCRAYDPHSDYMGKSALENFAISMKLSLFGIGALLRSEDGYCKIQEVMAGGPAARSKKLRPNDKIIAVQQAGQEPVDVVDMKLTKVVEMIRGPKGTEVTLNVLPAEATDPSARKSITLVRDEIKLEDQEAKAKIIDMTGPDGKTVRLGLIDLPSFYASFDLGPSQGKSEPRSTTADVSRLIKKLLEEKVSGIILDLRRNGGGSLEEAITLTGLFIKEGPIVQVRDFNDEVNVEYDRDPSVLYDGPLMVLTSRFSASASEILAAALQDYGRAVLVGDSSTHGKGTVQTIYELQKFMRRSFPGNYNPGAIKVTIRKFYRATGSSTQLKGVTPDIVLPSVNNYLETGETSQQFALQWDQIKKADNFTPLDRVQQFFEELRVRTAQRQKSDPEFAYVREDIERYQKALQDKSVSLNEQERLREKSEDEARVAKRKQERLARGESKDTIYEITLKQAAEPGLPPAFVPTNHVAKVTGTDAVPKRDSVAGTTAGATNQLAKSSAQAKAKDDADSDTSAQSADTADGVADADIEDHVPVVDIGLEETKRILADFISLTSPGRVAAGTATVKN